MRSALIYMQAAYGIRSCLTRISLRPKKTQTCIGLAIVLMQKTLKFGKICLRSERVIEI